MAEFVPDLGSWIGTCCVEIRNCNMTTNCPGGQSVQQLLLTERVHARDAGISYWNVKGSVSQFPSGCLEGKHIQTLNTGA